MFTVNLRHLPSLAVSALAIMLVIPTIAFALAPQPPSIFLSVSPETQDVDAGGSAAFEISVLPQGQWESGTVNFTSDSPQGVTVTFDPNPAELAVEALVTMTVTVASDASPSTVTLKITAVGKESSGVEVIRDATVTLNIKAAAPNGGNGGGSPRPVEGKTVTVTSHVTTTLTRSLVSTETVITTVTTTFQTTVGPPQDPLLTNIATILIALTAIILIAAAVLATVRGRR